MKDRKEFKKIIDARIVLTCQDLNRDDVSTIKRCLDVQVFSYFSVLKKWEDSKIDIYQI